MSSEQPAVSQLQAARDALAGLPEAWPRTREEYEAQYRRLEAEAADARETLNRARATYDGICEELRNLRIDWTEQQRRQAATEQ
ncbi:BAR domain-containing protein [Streptomyces rubiginosohelvolus]|uniref:hypothetical protein n=1 Tax=Streptomyces rubiginosohelvolus TaxID=67362 RepID=UPI00365D4144